MEDLNYKKIRRKRLNESLVSLRDRISLIEKELGDLTNDHFRVSIFGSARIKPEDSNYNIAYYLAFLMGKLGVDVLTGGGPGLMEAANKGTIAGRSEANTKARSFGLSIDLGKLEQPNPHLDIKQHHRKFSSRLDDFMRLSHVKIVLQGGIGTALELFYSWQLLQVNHLPEQRIILLGREYWGGLIEWVEKEMLVKKMVSEADMRFVQFVETPEEAAELVRLDFEEFKAQKIKQP